MKKDIHPQFYMAKAKCVCGADLIVGSTLPEIKKLEICSSCHPFYTGNEKIMDTAGRVERFKKQREVAKKIPKVSKKPKVPNKKK